MQNNEIMLSCRAVYNLAAFMVQSLLSWARNILTRQHTNSSAELFCMSHL